MGESFATEILKPIDDPRKTSPVIVHYGEWFPKFAASIVWRAVTAHTEVGVTFRESAASDALGRAVAAWKDFLMGRRGNPGQFELHVWAMTVDETREAAVYCRDHVMDFFRWPTNVPSARPSSWSSCRG